MSSGNRWAQRAVVAVVIGLLAVAVVLSLVPAAVAAPSPSDRHAVLLTALRPAPQPTDLSATESGNPMPVTKTPQGQATQVTDGEHIGGLVGFIVLMLGGVLLLIRDHHRKRVTRG
ncbi:hypothetical protein [Intrasporangium sp.]|uniref:hypothetical protein n=1 Tax=Intrasporangium sp. TaxID=1925024 RepID=UPI0032221815